MGIKKETNSKNNIINIYPWAIWYIIVVLIIGGGFILLMNVGPILIVIFENEPLKIFGRIVHNAWFLLFAIPIALVADHMYLKAVLWKVSFTKTHIKAPKIPKIQDKEIEVKCSEIINCELGIEGFNYYFVFEQKNGKKSKMSIIRFSFKQMEIIIKMIQERGGLINQNINEIINPLRIKKKK